MITNFQHSPLNAFVRSKLEARQISGGLQLRVGYVLGKTNGTFDGNITMAVRLNRLTKANTITIQSFANQTAMTSSIFNQLPHPPSFPRDISESNDLFNLVVRDATFNTTLLSENLTLSSFSVGNVTCMGINTTTFAVDLADWQSFYDPAGAVATNPSYDKDANAAKPRNQNFTIGAELLSFDGDRIHQKTSTGAVIADKYMNGTFNTTYTAPTYRWYLDIETNVVSLSTISIGYGFTRIVGDQGWLVYYLNSVAPLPNASYAFLALYNLLDLNPGPPVYPLLFVGEGFRASLGNLPNGHVTYNITRFLYKRTSLGFYPDIVNSIPSSIDTTNPQMDSAYSSLLFDLLIPCDTYLKVFTEQNTEDPYIQYADFPAIKTNPGPIQNMTITLGKPVFPCLSYGDGYQYAEWNVGWFSTANGTNPTWQDYEALRSLVSDKVSQMQSVMQEASITADPYCVGGFYSNSSTEKANLEYLGLIDA